MIYLKELPYYNPISERVTGHFLLSTFWVYFLLGVFNNDWNLAFKVYLFVIPLEVVGFEYFLKFNYRIDYMDPKQTRTYKCLKKIMILENES